MYHNSTIICMGEHTHDEELNQWSNWTLNQQADHDHKITSNHDLIITADHDLIIAYIVTQSYMKLDS